MRKLLFLGCLFNALCFAHSPSNDLPFFQKVHQPYHISVGAVLFNDQGKVAVLHRQSSNSYTLMRESMENDESIFETLLRGLQEEMGAKAEPIAFLGSLVGIIHSETPSFEKTTLYLACKLANWDLSDRNPDDYEITCNVEWLEPEEIIEHMTRQGKAFNQIDRDESEIIRRALPYIQANLSTPSQTE